MLTDGEAADYSDIHENIIIDASLDKEIRVKFWK